jgi:hypothetical protein
MPRKKKTDPTPNVPKKKWKPGVINNISAIEKRAAEVDKLSLFGASAMVPVGKISTVRDGMACRHQSQRTVLRNPEFPILFTGAENVFGERSSWNIKARDDYQIMKIFKKFRNVPCSPIAYIYKNLRTGKYGCEIVKPVINLVEKYGFQMTNHLTDCIEGDTIPKGTIMSQSSSYVDDNYCAGRNIRMMYTLDPELTEDALRIDETAAQELEYDMVDIVTVNVGSNAYLIDKYGTDGNYKPFPALGEEIKDNILCSVRENSFLSTRAEARIEHIGDTNYYSKGVVVDIDIFTNLEIEDKQLAAYAQEIKEWYSAIEMYVKPIVADPKQDDTSLIDIYHKAQKYLNDSSWVTKEYIVDTVIKFTILQRKEICIGQKVVNRYGGKSVVSMISKSEDMPRTDDGRPIQMTANGLALTNRIIAFAAYELTVTFMAERMHHEFIRMIDAGEKGAFEMVSDFLEIFSPNQAAELNRLAMQDFGKVSKDIYKNGIRIQVLPLDEICYRDAILQAYEEFQDILKPYDVYTKCRHRWVKLEKQHAIGYQYTYVLKQEPSKSMSTRSTGRTTLYDLPVKTRRYNNNLKEYSDNPIKFGEYDTYNLLAGIGVREFAKISTYFRGSQYEENSVLIGQLNDMAIDTEKYNKFPQIDNLKNVLKLLGIEMKPDIYGYSTVGCLHEIHDVRINNVVVSICIPDLRYILIMYSYYTQYEKFLNKAVDMNDFFINILEKTRLFEDIPDDYVNGIIHKFVQLLPVLEQLKEYE